MDSRCVAHHRARYRWPKVLSNIVNITVYDGIVHLLGTLTELGVKQAVVTSGRRDYCDKVLTHLKLPLKISVAYQDTKNHKPHAEPLLTAAQLFGLNPTEIVAVGDRHDDVVAAKAAGMRSVAALWGCSAIKHIREAKADHECSSVEELATLIPHLFAE